MAYYINPCGTDVWVHYGTILTKRAGKIMHHIAPLMRHPRKNGTAHAEGLRDGSLWSHVHPKRCEKNGWLMRHESKDWLPSCKKHELASLQLRTD